MKIKDILYFLLLRRFAVQNLHTVCVHCTLALYIVDIQLRSEEEERDEIKIVSAFVKQSTLVLAHSSN